MANILSRVYFNTEIGLLQKMAWECNKAKPWERDHFTNCFTGLRKSTLTPQWWPNKNIYLYVTYTSTPKSSSHYLSVQSANLMPGLTLGFNKEIRLQAATWTNQKYCNSDRDGKKFHTSSFSSLHNTLQQTFREMQALVAALPWPHVYRQANCNSNDYKFTVLKLFCRAA